MLLVNDNRNLTLFNFRSTNQALFTTEDEVLHNIEELSLVAKDLEQSPALSNTARRTLTDSVDSARGRADNLLDMAHEIKDSLEVRFIGWFLVFKPRFAVAYIQGLELQWQSMVFEISKFL